MTINTKFDISLYGELKSISPTLSSCRVRIFYKYGNRNGTYISDEFAEKLISSLPYTPIKGIFSNDDDMDEDGRDEKSGGDGTDIDRDDSREDYSDDGLKPEKDFQGHGENNEGSIYGIVPENWNGNWEYHLDIDGVNRLYYCADVILYTALYPEANIIQSKGQSMELYRPSIKGSFQMIDNQKLYVFEEGIFFGLQVLGDNVEPCFEGAAFYSTEQITQLKTLVDGVMIAFAKNSTKDTGGEKMPQTINFGLSSNDTRDKLWGLLNPNYNKDNDWTVDFSITDIFDDVMICYNYSEGAYYKIEYTVIGKDVTLDLMKKKKCFALYLTEEEEQKALENLKTSNEGTFKNIDSKFTKLQEDVTTLQTEKAKFELTLKTATETIETLKTENETFSKEKQAQESLEREAIFAKYSKLLDKETLAETQAAVDRSEFADNLSLEKELSYQYCSKKDFFDLPQTDFGLIPRADFNETDNLTELLNEYKRV